MRILHIDSSIQGEQSISRTLSAAVVKRLASPADTVVYRDLATDPIPQYSPGIAQKAAGLPADGAAERDTAVLTQVLEEVLAADAIVVGAPMYNFSIPTQLKSWVDALVVPGRTFSYGPQGVTGLLGGRRLVIASSRGGLYEAGSPAAAAEHQESLLRSLFGFLGVTQIEVVRAEGVRMGEDIAAQAVANALEHAARLAPLAA